LPKRESNDEVKRIARVVAALIVGDDRKAERELKPIAGITRLVRPLEPLPLLTRGPLLRRRGPRTRDPGRRAKAEVWVRDAFICRYCRRKTIPPDLLKIVSFRFPVAFGWQKNWNPPTHRAYWDISTSLDHLVAVSAGGDWRVHENLVTACYRCQEQKNDRAVAVEDVPPQQRSNWDGLTKSYEALYEAVHPPAGDHPAWITAFRTAWESGGRSLESGGRPRRIATEKTSRVAPQKPPAITAHCSTAGAARSANAEVALKRGMFIRARLPGKRSRRSYAVIEASAGAIQLRELWCESGVWVAGRQPYDVAMNAVEALEIRALSAPRPGDPASG
jgi:5-methylcytosine-specific restriction endonuclease McrA